MPTAVVLLSDKRSGSTMLQEELCRHPGVRHVDFSPHTYFETHHWLKAAVVLRRPEPLFVGGKTYAGYGSRENARAYLVETLTRNLPGYVPPADDRELVFGGWEALCHRFGTPVFFEKSPQILAQWAALSLLLEWIAATNVTVRIVFLVRNPLAVQYSAEQLFLSEPSVRQFAWLNSHRNLLAFKAMLPSQLNRFVRYEDLVANPQGTLRDLLEFIGLAPHPDVGAGVHGSSREKWRNDPRFILQLDPSVRQLAMHLGYTEEELENPNRDSHADPHEAAATARSQQRALRLALNRVRDRVVRPIYLRVRGRARTPR
jgi:hypothetical protein